MFYKIICVIIVLKLYLCNNKSLQLEIAKQIETLIRVSFLNGEHSASPVGNRECRGEIGPKTPSLSGSESFPRKISYSHSFTKGRGQTLHNET